MSVTKTLFGAMPDGREVFLYTITTRAGASASILDYGATWQRMRVPNRAGELVDVVLGYETLEEYRKHTMFLGATVGRVANRIGKSRFTLNGVEYKIFANDYENCCHGGREGFDKKIWKAEAEEDAVAFSLFSPDGDENFPGSLSVMVVYSLTEDNLLSIRYFAVTDQDTIVNLTNHAYFNLAVRAAARCSIKRCRWRRILQRASIRISSPRAKSCPSRAARSISAKQSPSVRISTPRWKTWIPRTATTTTLCSTTAKAAWNALRPPPTPRAAS